MSRRVYFYKDKNGAIKKFSYCCMCSAGPFKQSDKNIEFITTGGKSEISYCIKCYKNLGMKSEEIISSSSVTNENIEIIEFKKKKSIIEEPIEEILQENFKKDIQEVIPKEEFVVEENIDDPELVEENIDDPELVEENIDDPELVEENIDDPEPVKEIIDDPELVEEIIDDPEPVKEIIDDPEPVKEITGDPEPVEEITGDPEPVEEIIDDPEPVEEIIDDPELVEVSTPCCTANGVELATNNIEIKSEEEEEDRKGVYFVYIGQFIDESYWVSVVKDVIREIENINAGNDPLLTNLPIELIYYKKMNSWNEALFERDQILLMDSFQKEELSKDFIKKLFEGIHI